MIEALKKARTSITPCRPPFWAATGHLQTMLGHILPSQKLDEAGEKLLIPLEDYPDKIHSLYLKGNSRIVVYLFHGLGGSAEATYMHRTALVARNLGHHVFINNHRGCGEGAGHASGPYHSGRAEDLSAVVAYGREKFPDFYHIAIGFSLSANALLLMCANIRASVMPDFSIAVNGPIELDTTSINLSKGLNRIYDKRFVNELKNYIKKNRPEDLSRIRRVNNLRQFDEFFTAPVGGFINRADYYKSCSAKQYLKDIRVPTIILTAEDDPFVSAIDYKNAELSEKVVLHIEKHGGHMGYLTSDGAKYTRWLDVALRTYLQTAELHF